MVVDLEQAKESILKWMENFLEVEHPALGKWAPCPYARKARLDGRIEIRLGNDPMQDIVDMSYEGIGDKEVVVFVYDPQKFDAVLFHSLIQEGNASVQHRGYISLDDHPDSLEEVNGVVMNHGEYALSIVAPTANLDDASSKLYRAGYYDSWTEKYMDDVFRGRKDPRDT